jgi:pyroglutamyl-peptidase
MTPPSRPFLIMGFEPFGGDPVNPSAEVARQLHGTTLGEHPVIGLELPVVWERAPAVFERAVDHHRPEVVLLLGLAAGRSMLAVERIAINVLDFAVADNAGAQPAGEPVVPGGPAAYFTTLPAKAILAAWRAAGVPGYVSNTAGTYVCNQVLYQALHRAAGRGYRVGFLHLPYLPEQVVARPSGTPSMTLDVMVRGARLALEVAASRAEDIKLVAGAFA